MMPPIVSRLQISKDLKENKPEGVQFVGFQTGDDLFALYAHPKIFIFPSEYEAMSMALLEGLSFGVPTVYSYIPENEAVANNLGYSFLVSNADDLAKQLRHVFDNYDAAVSRGRKAVEVIREKHDWGKIAREYDRVYGSLAEN